MHVVPESAEVSSCGLRNISRTVYNIYSGAQVTVVPYKQFAHTCTVYVGSLRLPPIIYVPYVMSKYTNFKIVLHTYGACANAGG